MAATRSTNNEPRQARRMSVFVASPGDVAAERDAVSLVVAEINRVLGRHLGCSIETVRWETDARPGVGDDPQDVINQQIDAYDIFVGIMWRRFGTPTKRAASGTGEEFERALASFRKEGRPTIMFYFRNEPFYTTDERELKQFAKVAKFQRDLRKLGVLYWSYRSPLDFERNVREHLMRHLLRHLAVFTTNLDSLIESYSRSENLTSVRPSPEPRVVEGSGFAGISVSAKATGFASHSIFLAYAHADGDRARTIYRELTASGHRVWMDIEALLPGQMWWNEVESALRTASVFMPLVSERSSRGESGAAKELNLVLARGRDGPRVIPVRLDPVPLPSPFTRFQAVDFFLPDGLQRLLDALQRPPQSASAKRTERTP